MFEIKLGDEKIPAGFTIKQRTAVRGVFANDSGYLMILTNQGDYKFPGGGVDMKSIFIECQIDLSRQQRQKLEQYEHDQDFAPVFVPIEHAIENNMKLLAANPKDLNRWVRRETEVMQIIAQQMDPVMIGTCGVYCGVCEWKEKTNCPGCQICQSKPFWGECAIAKTGNRSVVGMLDETSLTWGSTLR